MMPPMEAFENVDSDVDADADKKELEVEEEELHSHHPGRMFGVHEQGQKDNVPTSKHKSVDPMDSVHSHRLGELPPKVSKAIPVAAKKQPQAPTPTPAKA